MDPKRTTYDPEYVFGPGAQVAEYLVEEKLAEGGMGEVWVGRHPKIGKRVAIKVLASDLVANKKSVTRFMQEARAVNEIRHRGLVDVFSFGELPDGRPYILMEFLEGKTLAEFLKLRKLLPFSEALELMRQISEALQAAHDKNVVHRDLKPENIFLILDGGSTPFVKILDFGIAKLTDPDRAGPNLTRTGAVFGTPAYMSPEQCEGSRSVDHRSDIYALGILTYEMLTGRTPFRESTDEGAGSIIAKQINNDAAPASALVTGRKIPKAVDAFLLGVLSKDPEERPQRCLDFYQGLVKAVGSLKNEDSSAVTQAAPVFGEAARRATTQPPKTGNYYAGAASSSNFSSKAGAALLGLLIMGGGVYWWMSQKETPTKITQPSTNAANTLSAETLPTQTPAKKVLFTIESSPKGANIFLDNRLLGITPLSIELDASDKESTVQLMKDGYEPKEFIVVLNSATSIEKTLKKASAASPTKKNPNVKENPTKENPIGDDPVPIDFDDDNKKKR
jgi:serine/threonine protein kinase